jgi:hypothetical protein
MNRNRDKAEHRAEIVHEASKWNVGGGIVVMALFPLAIPILVLTAVAALPLVLIPLAGALAAAVVAVPVLLLWGLGRRAIRALRPARTAEVGSPESRSGWAGSPPAGLHRS